MTVEDLQPNALSGRLAGGWGNSIRILDSTNSTMDEASTDAAAGADDGHVVLADQQTSGRGAHGRRWLSPPGTDLYLSVVVRPSTTPSSIALVTLATGLGVREAVATWLPNRAVQVKWPNDIWIERRKCAGILVESRTVGSRIDSLIIGVGLNVNRIEWPSELAGAATSLRIERGDDQPFDRAEVLAALLSHMEHRVTLFIEGGAQAVVNALRPNLALIGERVRWEDGEGSFEGIAEDGAARVRTSDGALSLHSAHIEPIES